MRASRLPLLAAFVVAGTLFAADAPLAPATRTIVLVRHGHYVADAQDSAPGPGLSTLGIAQAKLAAARLAAMPGTFDSLDVSPLTRAAETGAIIDAELANLHASTVAELAECTPRTRRKEISAKEKPEAMKACEDRLDALFRARFVPAQGTPRREILVCHGNVIRYLITRALGVDTEAWLEMSVAHGSLTTILVEADGRFKVIAIGDIGHVAPNLQTGSTGMSDKTLSVPH
jgi:serine/threonine-protein phosphatase PGAM5